jgi:hypothetical protein
MKATVYYRGQKIHDAFLKTIVKKHGLLEKATDVVVSGCSAGGLAVYLHVDEVSPSLPPSLAPSLPPSFLLCV